MTSSVPPVQIHVLNPDDEDDVQLTDVGVVTMNGERHLFLTPQSFDSAVRQVSSAMPDLPLEQVERMVRECGQFEDFDELLVPFEPAPPVDIPLPSAGPSELARPRGRAKRWVIAAALLPALAGSWALGHFTSSGTFGTAASGRDKSSSSTGTKTAEPFDDPKFMDFSAAGKIDCNPIDNLEAECTDADGMVMSTKAATGPDSTIFTFSYGSERLGLRIFTDTEYAGTWTKQDGSQELYPNLVRVGRYVLWGTDEERLKEYLKLLRSGPKKVPSVAPSMDIAEPLPPRLAALTLGTLGLGGQDVHTILSAPQDAPIDTPLLMAAQAVLGVTHHSPSGMSAGEDDIVALAAGIEPSEVVTAPDPSTNTPVVPVVDPAGSGSTPTGSGVSESMQETTTPRTDPTSAPKPTETTQTQEPDEEKPTPCPTSSPSKGMPPEPEQAPTPPADPTPSDTETLPQQQEPAPTDPRPLAGSDGETTQQPVMSDPGTTDTPVAVTAGDTDSERLALPQAGNAPAE
ncbi:hypothetical protein [Streptomyces rhizosphaericus]|uniref:Uncharacterized protein n=1 Tax=Streptomyces rhizosphaericus TaxID=114699 RepID=A0A6G4AK21_9ACTN|nr:hypothetical protein [Streptomyces rhizosphaericus]NEW73786.1 hypothetical protein [Streptomyces rhizosphaericus]